MQTRGDFSASTDHIISYHVIYFVISNLILGFNIVSFSFILITQNKFTVLHVDIIEIY